VLIINLALCCCCAQDYLSSASDIDVTSCDHISIIDEDSGDVDIVSAATAQSNGTDGGSNKPKCKRAKRTVSSTQWKRLLAAKPASAELQEVSSSTPYLVCLNAANLCAIFQ